MNTERNNDEDDCINIDEEIESMKMKNINRDLNEIY